MYVVLPEAVMHAISTLNTAGYEAYVVGGCVRDSLMGKTPTDWDITTSASPTELQMIFSHHRCIETGLQHGTLTVLLDGIPLEITSFRTEGAYSDGRHPDAVTFTRSLKEDLCRRDFTINAMAYHPQIGLVDLYDGQSDLEKQIIRCVGNAKQRLHEDALRILRALRFAAVLGFKIEEDTDANIRELSPSLDRISIERITSEFKKLLCGADVARVLSTFKQEIAVFFPEITQCKDFSLLTHVRAIPYARLAALFKVAKIDSQVAAAAMRRLRFDNQTIDKVCLLLEPLTTRSFSNQDTYALHLLNRFGPELVYDYLAIDEAEASLLTCVDRLLKAGACYCISMLAVTGDDVITAGVAAGPAVGCVLNGLLNAVMNGDCTNQKADLLNHIDKMKKPVQ